MEKHVGIKAKIQVLPDQPDDVPYTCADVSKAAHLLGYTSTISLDEGIRRTVEFYKIANSSETKEQPRKITSSLVEYDNSTTLVHNQAIGVVGSQDSSGYGS